MEKFKVIIGLLPLFFREPHLWTGLEEKGVELLDLRGQADVDRRDFIRHLKTVPAIVLGNLTQADQRFFSLAPELKFPIKMGVGVDNIDLAAATRQGVLVFNSPGANTDAVADYAFGLILALARRITQADRITRTGQWKKIMGRGIWGKTLGVIGLGAIGRAVARRGRGFEMSVLACDPFWPENFARDYGVRQVGLDELLRLSDVVTIHCPLTLDTDGLIGARELEMMKPSSFLINTARGQLIDERALARALSDGVISGAALDAFQDEPLRDSPLLELDNIILSPHTAWFTREAIDAMNEMVFDQILQLHEGRLPEKLVNQEALAGFSWD